MAKSGAWKAPRDLTITERQANGYWSDRSQDRDQEAAPELRTATPFKEGWPKNRHYRIQRMHLPTSVSFGDGVAPKSARTANGPDNKGASQSNRGGRIKRNTYAQAGKTG